jgi:hypothetical protein
MIEHEIIEISGGKADLGLRSMLLTAVMEGGRLDSDEVSSFVSRLSAFDGEFEGAFETLLS